ncbi:LOW QUALITY PROTEIN: hypothetical protein U9M48_004954 [Paspalum notatum var. saurae]|uniref:Reverse transcriptase domain-containing protein n=1 Tax=Paspalum notatum var. saurae TaxID=547442 RepID=A0AAQ3PWK5_PASNO
MGEADRRWWKKLSYRRLGWMRNSCIAFITLLPKKTDAVQVKDFRPISLIHSFAKLATKILANRLAPMLPRMVSINKSAFVKGRSIQDNFLLVQQMARALHNTKEPHVLLKLDISKAFDSVSWSFLIEVMTHVGFGPRWRNLICLLLCTSSTRILVNGDPGESIKHQRGLRQGDPLSPMLFILVMEALNSLMNFATANNLLQPLGGQQGKFRLSFYADDVVMFLCPSTSDLQLSIGFIWAHLWSQNQYVEEFGTSVIPIQCTEDDLRTISECLPCEIKGFPCSYLGIPLSIGKPAKATWLPLIDKVADNLPSWKASLMSKAGPLITVNVVFSGIPIYMMAALDLPKWAIQAIDKVRRGFLWKGHEKANGGNCIVAWEHVQRPLQYGGLGLLNLEKMGWALRIRWLWMQKTDTSRPWAGMPIHIPNNARALFNVVVETIVGNGESTKFWSDRWLQGKTAAEVAPDSIKLVPKRTVKQRTVAQALNNNSWARDIKGALTVTVLIEYMKLWDLVSSVVIRHELLDQHIWRLTGSGCYSCKSAYNSFFLGPIKFGPWKRI